MAHCVTLRWHGWLQLRLGANLHERCRLACSTLAALVLCLIELAALPALHSLQSGMPAEQTLQLLPAGMSVRHCVVPPCLTLSPPSPAEQSTLSPAISSLSGASDATK